MPFQVGQVCYPDAGSALDAWQASFISMPDSTGVMWSIPSTWAPTINSATGLISGVLTNSSTGVFKSFVVYLSPCSAQSSDYVFDKMPLGDMVFAVALVFAFIIGFGHGRRLF